ncbi:MAG: sulfatase-like hydrolase/transferase [Rikenellaceae bacterium]
MNQLNKTILALSGILPAAAYVQAATPKQPNVIIFFVDDMGYGDTSPFGSKKNPTPNIQRMAEEGIIHNQFYLSSTNSTPSRAALLTGCYANTVGMEGKVNWPMDKRGLDPEETILPEIFKTKGYVTACFGKWHLGDQPEFMPTKQGFDYFEGLPYSNDMYPLTTRIKFPPLPYIKGEEVVAHVASTECQTLLIQTTTEATVDFIRKHKRSPFFIYVPYTAPHLPRFARKEIVDECGGNVLSAQIKEIDDGVGAVLDALRKMKLDDNTLVIFTSDNGGSARTSMGGLRGSKAGPVYEGHSRASTIVWHPGVVAAGGRSRKIICSKDILPSLAAYIGADTSICKPIDGENNLDVLLGAPEAKSKNDTLYYQLNGIRVGAMKLIKINNRYELYNLERDEGEKKNIIKDYPAEAEQLKAALTRFSDGVVSNARKAAFVENPTAILPDAEGVPTLCEYLKESDIVAIGEDL